MGDLLISIRIYNFLKLKPYTISEIHEEINSQSTLLNGRTISRRTVYRYIENIHHVIDPETEVFEIEKDQLGRNWFFIRSIKGFDKNTSDYLSYVHWIRLMFVRVKSEEGFFSEFNQFLLKSIPLKSRLLIDGNGDMSVFKVSNFGEMKLTTSHKEIIDIFLTGKRQSLAIMISYSSFVKLNSQIPHQSEQLAPMNIEIHRGTFSFKVYSKWSKKVYSLELDMIKEIKLCSKLVSNEYPLDLCNINSRFGYHMPICEGVHKVVLRFPQTPGMHVRNRIWHESQVFKESKLGYVDLYLNVEINIELLGWIMMWMDNVQVLEPQILIQLVQEKLTLMGTIHSHKKDPISNEN